MSDQLRDVNTMVDSVDAALETMLAGVRDSSTARRAVMYAEAIDDDDEGDGMFRYGPKLRVSLEALGLAVVARTLLLPPPMFGRLQLVGRPGGAPAARSLDREALVA